ncbi:tyrosine-protein kinase domain-containing protein [Microbacterium xylanilyticum]
MEFPSLVRTLRRQLVLVIASTVVGLSSGLLISLATPQRFEASTDVYISAQSSAQASTADRTQASAYTRQAVESYRMLITSSLVLQPVIDDLRLPTTVPALAPTVRATTALNSLVITISVTAPVAVQSARIANAIADSFRTVVEQGLEKPSASATYQIRVIPVQSALVPIKPVAPNLPLSLTVGAFAGLAVGIALALLRSRLDTRVHTRDELEAALGLPVLAATTFDPSASQRTLVLAAEPRSSRSEPYRVLRTNVMFFVPPDRPGVFAVTSSSPGEGKSTLTANLALSFTEAGHRVALLDADMRKPRVAANFGVNGDVGLSDVLAGRININDALQRWKTSTLFVLPAGAIPPNPAELLGSKAMEDLIEQLTAAFDIVLVDTPPVLPVTDAVVISRVCTGVILAAASRGVAAARIAESADKIDAAGGRVIGAVLTKQPMRGVDRNPYAAYGHAEDAPRFVTP